MKLVVGLGVVDGVVARLFMGLLRGSGFACSDIFIYFFFFLCCVLLTVMIFHKPHRGGWVLMWDRQNVGFGGC